MCSRPLWPFENMIAVLLQIFFRQEDQINNSDSLACTKMFESSHSPVYTFFICLLSYNSNDFEDSLNQAVLAHTLAGSHWRCWCFWLILSRSKEVNISHTVDSSKQRVLDESCKGVIFGNIFWLFGFPIHKQCITAHPRHRKAGGHRIH